MIYVACIMIITPVIVDVVNDKEITTIENQRELYVVDDRVE